MIEKLLPRVLNSSSDNRLKKKTEMNDAYNIVVTEDFDDFNGSTSTGNEGVLKPVKGNGPQAAIPENTFNTDDRRRVLGSVSDARTGVVYFFVFSELAGEHGVYAYDTTNYFGSGEYVYVPIYTTSEFNFQQDSVVQGDIVHVAGDAGDFRPVLYFTDNVNEPRKLDVLRAREGVGYFANSVHEKDFITACPKAPMHPVEFYFERDADRGVSDFRRIPGFQFAYQCLYYSGEESAISTYSDIAVPPQYVRQSLYANQVELANVCRLSIPAQVNGVNSFTREIRALRILVRQGNTGAFFVVDEVPYSGLQQTPTTYNFYNDRVVTGITTEEEQKQFDSLPRVAQALAVVEDRLFYGNYVEGYDEPGVIASVQAAYVERPADFVDVDVTIRPAFTPLHGGGLYNYADSFNVSQSSVSYELDTSQIDDNIPANTRVSVSITVNPEDCYALYNSSKSYHPTPLTGHADDIEKNGLERNKIFHSDDYYTEVLETGTDYTLSGQRSLYMFGRNLGVAYDDPTPLMWKCTEAAADSGQEGTDVPVTVGSSPLSALKVPGKSVRFYCEFEITEDVSNGKEVVLNAICACFDDDAELPGQVEIISSVDTPFIDWDHGFVDPTETEGVTFPSTDPNAVSLSNLSLEGPLARASTAAIIPNVGRGTEMARLITPVNNNTDDFGTSESPSDSSPLRAPRGYFILNKGTAFFRLKQLRHKFPSNDDKTVLRLEISNLSGIEAKTCIPIIDQKLSLTGWRVYSAQYLITHSIVDDFDVTFGTGPFGIQFRPITTPSKYQGDNNVFLDTTSDDRASLIGYLHTDGLEYVTDENLYASPDKVREVLAPGVPDYIIDNAGFSLVDGGALNRTIERPRSFVFDGETIFINHSDSDFIRNIGHYGFPHIIGIGVTPKTSNNIETLIDFGNIPVSYFGSLEENKFSAWQALAQESFGTVTHTQRTNNQAISSPIAGASYDAYIDQQELTGGFRSFKTHSNHDFGVVYYDERGRAGNVNRLDSVYVEGYSDAERGPNKGRVQVEISLQSAPPDWAHFYQIVYAGSSSVRDFIQYSVGGAFTAVNNDQDLDAPGKNIYVSLNYLQENNEVSYSKAFGAVATDGTQNLYVYSPGDFVRVVSHYTDDTTPVYEDNIIFEVADVVNLGGTSDDNPLVPSGGEVPPHLQGQFLVLKDNNGADGFRFLDVASGSNSLDSDTHNWGNRCIVEVISPRSTVDPEDRVYHEISEVYNVGRNGGAVFHQSPVVVINNGDVWWRRVPVALSRFNSETLQFENLIRTDEGEITEPNFRQVWLESKTFTDVFPGADVNGFGKRKFVSTLSNEVRRFSSVTFSDQNDYSTKRLRFTSFNAYNAPFKDLPNEHGNINSLINLSDSLFVVQEDKASAIPVSRSVLSDALGQDTLISSDKILGSQVFYAGAYGSDNNPESVIKVDNNIYFAHKSKGEVYRFNPSNGIQVISRKGMNSFFRDAFQDAIDDVGPVRVVSGYDPLNDEYLITISNFTNLGQTQDFQYTQPNLPIAGPTSDVIGADPEGGLPSGDPEAYVNGILEPANTGVNSAISFNDTQLRDLVDLASQVDAFEAAYNAVTNWNDYLTSPGVINLDGFLTPQLAEMASFLSWGGPGGTASATYNSSANSLVFDDAATAVLAISQPSGGGLFLDSDETYLDHIVAGQLTGDPTGQGLINQAAKIPLVYQFLRNKLSDDLLEQIVVLKNGLETDIAGIVGNVAGVIDNVSQDIAEAGLGSNPNVAALLSSAIVFQSQLDNHYQSTLGAPTPQTFSFISNSLPNAVVTGFSQLNDDEYPYGEDTVNALSTTLTFLENLNTPISSLQTFGGIDISDALDSLIDENAGLRGQIDVLTNQIQNLSSAPFAAGISNPLIDGVQPEQLTSTSLDVLDGGDNQLTFDDVRRDFSGLANSIEFLIANANPLQVTPDVAKQLSAEVIRGLVDASGLSTDPNLSALGYSSYRNKGDTFVLKEFGRQANVLDFNYAATNGPSVFGVNDVLTFLGNFEPDAQFFGSPVNESGSREQTLNLLSMLNSSDPYAQYQQDIADGKAGAGPSSALSKTNLLRAVMGYRNGLDGSLDAAIAAIDPGLLTVQPSDIGAVNSDVFLFYGNPIYDNYPPEQLASFYEVELAFIQSAPAALFENSSRLAGGYLSQFGVNFFANFSNAQPGIQQLTTEDLDSVIVNAINTING